MEARRAEVVDYAEVRREVGVALDTGNLPKVKEILEEVSQLPDRTRSAAENLFVYRTLGKLYGEIEMIDESMEAYGIAYTFDSRDLEVLRAKASTALEEDPGELPIEVIQRLLVHHRYGLPQREVSRYYKAVGRYQEKMEDLEKAQITFEKALEFTPGDMEIIESLLGLAEKSGDGQAALNVREKLLSTLTKPESRAAVLVAIGDDYAKKIGDLNRAIDSYERALAECESSEPALMRIADVAIEKEDWHRAISSLSKLSKLVDEDNLKSEFLQRAASLTLEKQDDKGRAIELYNDILDIQPLQLDTFKTIARLLFESKDWTSLDQNYTRMIARHTSLSAPKNHILVVLNRNLGELRLKQLEDVEGAAKAYQAASDLAPDEVSYHKLLANLYSQLPEKLQLAVKAHRNILRLAPDHIQSVDALANLYREMEAFDESLLIYRVLDAINRIDSQGNAIVEKFTSTRSTAIDGAIPETLWKTHIYPEYLDDRLVKLFSLTQPALIESFAHDLEHYRLKKKEARFDLDQPSFFSKVFHRLVKAMGLSGLPTVFVNPNQNGLRNGYLLPPGFLVGKDLLSGREEKEIAFFCAKALTLFRPEFFLTQFGGPNVLKVILLSTLKTFRPSLNIETNKNIKSISKLLEKKLTEGDKKQLERVVDEILDTEGNPDVSLFIEAAEDTANRVGLLFGDDPKAVQSLLDQESSPLGNRSAPERFGSLLMWALSEEYASLRKSLGIAIG